MFVPAMDCPHCKASNPVGATNCATCRAPLVDSAATIVAELTPPADSGDLTIIDGAEARPYRNPQATVDGPTYSSMEIPPAWPVPPSAQSLGDAGASLTSFKPASLLANPYQITHILAQPAIAPAS